jgi:hypothetical protein
MVFWLALTRVVGQARTQVNGRLAGEARALVHSWRCANAQAPPGFQVSSRQT